MNAVFARQFHSELLKLKWSRTFTVLLVLVLTTTAMTVYGTAKSSLEAVADGPTGLVGTTHDLVRLSFGALLFGTVYGVISYTGEVRHGSLARTLLTQPVRDRVLAAKSVVCALVGLVYGAVALIVAAAVAHGMLTAHHQPFLLDREIWLTALGVLLVNVLSPLWGLALGVLMRHQTLAVGVVVLWTLLLEALLIELIPAAGRFLPGGAQEALYREADRGVLPMLPGGLLWCAYVLAAAVCARTWLRRSDVT